MLEEKRRVVRHIPIKGAALATVKVTKSRHGYERIGHNIGCLCEGCEFEVIAGAEGGDKQAVKLLKGYI